MAISQQKLHSIHYDVLKNLRNLFISFEPHNVTGIFGINGCGKSTIIHSLLCLYKPTPEEPDRENYKFSKYFTHTSLGKWSGSSFKISHSYRDDATSYNEIPRGYKKGNERWAPRYGNRPVRNVYFIGIDTCVPDIESEKSSSLIRLTSVSFNDPIHEAIRQKAGYIMNRDYSIYNQYNGAKKKYAGVKVNEIKYSSLSMGAGEQRVFKILNTVFKAPKYSLIIIDEIDLTLHTDALSKLINVLVDRCAEKNIQIIFTSHREELTKRTDINIRHIHQTTENTICFDKSTPDCLMRLTGIPIRSLEIFVEDNLASLIVKKIADEEGVRRHCSITKYGAIDNSFSLAMGILLKGDDISRILIVTDGDKYVSDEDKKSQMKNKFSGNEPNADAKRQSALSMINQLSLPANTQPEQFINQCLKDINDDSEIIQAANSIHQVNDKHEYVDKIIELLGYENENEGLQEIVSKLRTSDKWEGYTSNIRNWLRAKKQELNLN